MTESMIDVLRGSALLANLPDDVLGELVKRVRKRVFAAGEVLFDKGDPGDTMYVVRSGMIEIRRTVATDGFLARLGPGKFFGELTVFDPAPRSAAAIATEESDLVEFGRDDLEQLFADDPSAAMAMVGAMARETTTAKEQVKLVNDYLEVKVRERTEQVRETQLEVIRRLGRAAEFRDDDTGEHIYRVSHYAKHLAQVAGFDEVRAEKLLVAAPMHDIGKIGIPDRILLKPGKLDAEEWEIMQSHTIMGGAMLAGSTSETIKLAQQVALQHHERWDGKGYPNNLKGEEISLEARVCTIADVFDALTSRRPYKDPWTFDDALAEIEKCGGTMFDPELAKMFVGLEHVLRDVQASSSDGRVKELPSMKLE